MQRSLTEPHPYNITSNASRPLDSTLLLPKSPTSYTLGPSFRPTPRPVFYRSDFSSSPPSPNFSPDVKLPPIRKSNSFNATRSIPLTSSVSFESSMRPRPSSSANTTSSRPPTTEAESRPPSSSSGRPSSTGRTRRNRTGLSCQECRRRKISCDRSEPCASCVRRGKSESCCKPTESIGEARLNSATDKVSSWNGQYLPSPPPTSTPLAQDKLEHRALSQSRSRSPSKASHPYHTGSEPSLLTLGNARKRISNGFYLFKKGDLDLVEDEENIFAWTKPHTFLQ